jgi:hypothetical protein
MLGAVPHPVWHMMLSSLGHIYATSLDPSLHPHVLHSPSYARLGLPPLPSLDPPLYPGHPHSSKRLHSHCLGGERERESERRWVGRDEERHVEMECVCERERCGGKGGTMRFVRVGLGCVRLTGIHALESFQPELLV